VAAGPLQAASANAATNNNVKAIFKCLISSPFGLCS